MAQRFGWREKIATEITGAEGGPVSVEHTFGQVSPSQAQAIAREFLIGVAPTHDGEEQESEDDDDDESSEQEVSTISRVLRSTDAASDE